LFGLTTVAAQSLLARARDAFRDRWNSESDVVVGVRRDD
jgi:hypothetical protein